MRVVQPDQPGAEVRAEAFRPPVLIADVHALAGDGVQPTLMEGGRGRRMGQVAAGAALVHQVVVELVLLPHGELSLVVERIAGELVVHLVAIVGVQPAQGGSDGLAPPVVGKGQSRGQFRRLVDGVAADVVDTGAEQHRVGADEILHRLLDRGGELQLRVQFVGVADLRLPVEGGQAHRAAEVEHLGALAEVGEVRPVLPDHPGAELRHGVAQAQRDRVGGGLGATGAIEVALDQGAQLAMLRGCPGLDVQPRFAGLELHLPLALGVNGAVVRNAAVSRRVRQQHRLAVAEAALEVAHQRGAHEAADLHRGIAVGQQDRAGHHPAGDHFPGRLHGRGRSGRLQLRLLLLQRRDLARQRLHLCLQLGQPIGPYFPGD
ncbi:hypothetical protein D9M68_593490 [compost metagenome]